MAKKIWWCKVGEAEDVGSVTGPDLPMRAAVSDAYFALTGQRPDFIFSGWHGQLDESQRAVVEDRLPNTSSGA